MKVRLSLVSFAVGVSLVLCSIGASAQTDPKPIDAATKFDEYGRIGGCDHSARLDNLATTLQSDTDLEGYLVYYGPESASELTLGIIKDYLVNSRGLSEERWQTIYAGPNSDPTEPRIQLWLAPRGAPPPELIRYESKVESFSGLFVEQARWDSIYFGEDGGTGPPVPGVALPTFIDMLNRQKDSIAYVVAFNGAEATPGTWRRVAQLESETFQRRGVEASRIRVIYGGTDKETKIQLWILPETAPPPVGDAGPEPPPKKAAQLGDFSDSDLGDERRERWAFNGFADVLRARKDLRACIIVRFETEDAEKESETESKAAVQSETPPAEESIPSDLTIEREESDETPTADLLKLVEKWKAELADKYKISQDRFIVLFGRNPNNWGSSLETWIVPAGAPLPDPSIDPDAEVVDEAVEETADPGEKPPPTLTLPDAKIIQ